MMQLPRGAAPIAALIASLALAACGVVEVLMPPGEARWALAPGAEIGPETTEFVAMVTEMACAGGQSSAGRIIGPDISVTDESITVTFRARARSGPATCPGNPATPVVVELPEPLGDRTLLDGGTDPPRDPPECADPTFCE
jgi:hypothetical protein